MMMYVTQIFGYRITPLTALSLKLAVTQISLASVRLRYNNTVSYEDLNPAAMNQDLQYILTYSGV